MSKLTLAELNTILIASDKLGIAAGTSTYQAIKAYLTKQDDGRELLARLDTAMTSSAEISVRDFLQAWREEKGITKATPVQRIYEGHQRPCEPIDQAISVIISLAITEKLSRAETLTYQTNNAPRPAAD